MGGFGSGWRGGCLTTEQTLTLDMSRCLRLQQFRPGVFVGGAIRWTSSQSDRVVAEVSYRADMRAPDNGRLRLMYVTADSRSGERQERDELIDLVVTRPNFGGVRWWFRCPRSNSRVRCLHHDGHDIGFASRKALGLGYGSQRESWHSRCSQGSAVSGCKAWRYRRTACR